MKIGIHFEDFSKFKITERIFTVDNFFDYFKAFARLSKPKTRTITRIWA